MYLYAQPDFGGSPFTTSKLGLMRPEVASVLLAHVQWALSASRSCSALQPEVLGFVAALCPRVLNKSWL